MAAGGTGVKPIRLIMPSAPGGTADIGSRYIAQELSKALGQPVVVENKPGAGGTIGTAELARAAADGYTIGIASQPTLVFNQGIYAKPGYDSLKDFAPIALLGRAGAERDGCASEQPGGHARRHHCRCEDEAGDVDVLVRRQRYEPPRFRCLVRSRCGLVAPAGTPPEIVGRLNAEVNKILASAETQEKLGAQGFELSAPLTPEGFSKPIADDLNHWVPVVKAVGAKAD